MQVISVNFKTSLVYFFFFSFYLRKLLVVVGYCLYLRIAVENLGAFSSSSSDFISALGHKTSSVSGEERETSFLF